MKCPYSGCSGTLKSLSTYRTDMACFGLDRNYWSEAMECLKCKRTFNRQWRWNEVDPITGEVLNKE